ncbi:D-arabinono-1,4-lactone oxidase [Brevibacillus laterosporus]|uniref:D-arabinono-1,4-lactone oxidase n=1 Tax=Brevibacillus laterosporus TaxID=1465 RepID=UPI00144457B6|nr:D-arabinono-1,4-lactone oxidase [Brevibacillus laterosporus]NKQ18513.1 FAD-binding protein [Brevibacillus laterosporus]WNX33285.1 D-arabinono-1,4-lactone oxidase [Brevibacillus laterosporus]
MRAVAMQSWKNWAGLVTSTPQQVVYPSSLEEVVQVVKEASQQGKTIRVVGSGHSFTALVETDQILLSLDDLQGVITIDDEEQTATVWAGTKLKLLGESLYERGYSQENLGDINAQSIGGAISTGTHGTGIQFGSVSTQVVGLTVVTAQGDILECSETYHPELFRALQVSLGLLGIIVKVRLRVLLAYNIHYKSKRMNLNDCLNNLTTFTDNHRHFEFYWFVHTNVVQAKFMQITQEPASKNSVWNQFKKIGIENGLFWFLSEGCRLFPHLCVPISKLSAKAVPDIEEVGASHKLFATPRWVRFSEMEYSVPADKMKEVMEEIRECLQEHRFAVHFPIECRYVKGDDIWLSPAYKRDSAYIAVHMYKGMPYEAYFQAMERIFLKYDGRPHWGKLHELTTADLQERFPMWNQFKAIQRQMDPNGLFLNPYLSRLFGV